ncbi:MAG: hypothetical protein ACRED5_09095 [Propylenella sp.]
MSQLLLSTNPLLALAGTLFVIGVCFDLIFSDPFKSRVKTLVAEPAIFSPDRPALITAYARDFVLELWQPDKRRSFLWKTVALSTLFYVIIAVLEIRTVSDLSVQGEMLQDILLFRPSVLSLFGFHMAFDVGSAYVTILYLRLSYNLATLRDVLLLFSTDIIVKAAIWSMFFAVALALFVKVADYEVRWADVAVRFEEDAASIEWKEQSVYHTNTTLVGKRTWRGTFLTRHDRGDPFSDWPLYVWFAVATNHDDPEIVAKQLLALASAEGLGRVAELNGESGEPISLFRNIGTRRVLSYGDVVTLARFLTNLTNPVPMIFDRKVGYYYWQTIKSLYEPVIQRYFEDRQWTGNLVVVCGEQSRVMSHEEAFEFDFGSCNKYWFASEGVLQGMNVVAGYYFQDNYRISYMAFFWSSMALTLSFYCIFLAVLFWKYIRMVGARAVVGGVLRLEKALFTCLFSVGSVILLFSYGLTVIIRWALT